jgi:hypothetical protein
VQLAQLSNRNQTGSQLNALLSVNPAFAQLGVGVSRDDDIPSLTIPDLTMDTAMTLKTDNQEDFVSYLVLANAYLQEQRPSDSWQTIAEGRQYAPNDLIYIVSAAQISRRNFDAVGAVGYAILALHLAQDDSFAYRLVLNQMGEILYEFAPILSEGDLLNINQQVLTPNLASASTLRQLPLSAPALYAEALRQFGQGDYTSAQSTIERIDNDQLEAERRLLQAEIAYALGDSADSDEQLADLADEDNLPMWLRERVQALLQAKDTQ